MQKDLIFRKFGVNSNIGSFIKKPSKLLYFFKLIYIIIIVIMPQKMFNLKINFKKIFKFLRNDDSISYNFLH